MKAWKFVAARAPEGFTAPAELAAFYGEELSGIRGVTSLVGLKAPLAGWLVHAKDDTIELVDPGNKSAFVLGTVPGDGQPSLVQVVLNPSAPTSSSPCRAATARTAASTFVRRWALPSAAVPASP